jgi:hypothetical protein
MGERTKVGISADRIVALIAALLMVGVGINRVVSSNIWVILFSIVSIILGIFLIIVLNVFEVKALEKIPYGLWVLALVSAVLVLICVLGGVVPEAAPLISIFLLTTILMLCATLINVLSEKESYVPSKIVVLVGAGFAIYESALLFTRGQGIDAVWYIFVGIIGILLAAILIISMSEKINVPFAWWLVLIIGFAFFWVFSGIFAFGWDAGIVVLVGFILMIFAY